MREGVISLSYMEQARTRVTAKTNSFLKSLIEHTVVEESGLFCVNPVDEWFLKRMSIMEFLCSVEAFDRVWYNDENGWCL